MRILAFAASLREGSYNKKLIRLATKIARDGGAEVDLADFEEFVCPNYNQDVQDADGVAEGAKRLESRLDGVDGLMISSPEYNFSIPGTLKNTIDWVSRLKPMPLAGKSGLLLAASRGVFGGIRGLWQLRIPLECLQVALYPDMYALPSGGSAFTEEGGLEESARQERLEKLVANYLKFGRALAAAD